MSLDDRAKEGKCKFIEITVCPWEIEKRNA